MFEVFLEEQAESSIRQCEKQIIILGKAVRIAREGVLEQLQLVIGGVRRRNATFIQFSFHVGSHRINFVEGAAYQHVKVCVDQQLVLLCYQVQHHLDVCLSDLVRRVWHRAMSFRLAL